MMIFRNKRLNKIGLTRSFHTGNLREVSENLPPPLQVAFHVPEDTIIQERLSATDICLK